MLRRPATAPSVAQRSGDMVSAAQSYNITFKSILDGHKGYDKYSKLNSLALVKLVFKIWSNVDLL